MKNNKTVRAGSLSAIPTLPIPTLLQVPRAASSSASSFGVELDLYILSDGELGAIVAGSLTELQEAARLFSEISVDEG